MAATTWRQNLQIPYPKTTKSDTCHNFAYTEHASNKLNKYIQLSVFGSLRFWQAVDVAPSGEAMSDPSDETGMKRKEQNVAKDNLPAVQINLGCRTTGKSSLAAIDSLLLSMEVSSMEMHGIRRPIHH
ncbi:UNVERIFIED_CONTAM: hypothetical protein Sindi_2215800 [Sesamum indicum]